MSTPIKAPRAQNAFAPQLSQLPIEPPRRAKELRGLSVASTVKTGLTLPLIFAAFFTIMPFIIATTDKDFQSQRRALQRAPGVVLQNKRQVSANGTSDNTYTTVKYSFRAQGQTFYGSQFVPLDSPFALLKSGAPLSISYDPNEPTFNGVAGVLGKNAFPFPMLFLFPLMGAAGALVFGAPLLFGPLRTTWRARRVFQRGVLTVGRVRFVKTRPAVSSPYKMPGGASEVFYEFMDESGKTVESKQACDNDWLLQKLDVGTEITVAHLAGKPKQNVFLEAFIE